MKRSDTQQPRQVPCPHCGQPAVFSQENKWRPFCSERCRLIDLGEWFAEEHAIPGQAAEIPEDSNDS